MVKYFTCLKKKKVFLKYPYDLHRIWNEGIHIHTNKTHGAILRTEITHNTPPQKKNTLIRALNQTPKQ